MSDPLIDSDGNPNGHRPPVRVVTAASLFEAETNCLPNLAALISGNTENDGALVSAF